MRDIIIISMELISGKHIKIHMQNNFFLHVVTMVLEHFDKPEYNKYLFILGSCSDHPAKNFKYELPDHKVVVYQFEQLMGLFTWKDVNDIIDNISSADEIWDYDYLNAAYLKERSVNVSRIIPLLYSSNLKRIKQKEHPEIDVLFYGYMNERRFNIFKNLQIKLYGRASIVWVYGDSELDKYISNCKTVLNLHAAEPWNRQEQVRLFYPVINGITCISESSQINNMPGEIIETSADALHETIIDVCYSDKWKTFGANASEKFKQRTKEYLNKNFGTTDFNF